jgi:heat-inducible transcriptional repressor
MFQPAVPGHLSQSDPDLSPRLRSVFAALVACHGRTARPVGSESLARDSAVPFSAATVRAALADLEDAGLVERADVPGRVPSRSGYEYFVRVLLEPEALPAELREEIRRRLNPAVSDVEALLGEASRVISALTRLLGLAHAGALDDEPLAALDLEPLDEQRALLVLHLGDAAVRTLALELESPLERSELAVVCGVLRERLLGRPLAEVRDRLATDPELARSSAARMVARAAVERWSDPAPPAWFSAGAVHMAEQPEFMERSRLSAVLSALESRRTLSPWLAPGAEGQAAVRVGLEIAPPLAGCSLVSYALPGRVWGAVGVLGPRRMDYARVLAVVDAVGDRVADLLQA